MGMSSLEVVSLEATLLKYLFDKAREKPARKGAHNAHDIA